MTAILVAGIGNIFFGDDGFGSEVARRLEHRAISPAVHVVDFGIRSFDLAFALMNPYDSTIIVDTMRRGGTPGTIYVVEPELSELSSEAATVEAHVMDPTRVLALARTMGADLTNILIVGCEPETFGPEDEGKMGLSPAVAGAVECAIDVIQSLIRKQTNAKVRGVTT